MKVERPANSTTLMPPQQTLRLPQQQRTTEQGAKAKQSIQPAATSSPKPPSPTPMETDIPSSLFNQGWGHKQIDAQLCDIDKFFKFGKTSAYNHPKDGGLFITECRKSEEQWEERTKSYVVRHSKGIYRMFRNPAHRDHIPEWWNFLSTFQKEKPLSNQDRAAYIKQLLKEADKGHLYCVTLLPPSPLPDPPGK